MKLLSSVLLLAAGVAAAADAETTTSGSELLSAQSLFPSSLDIRTDSTSRATCAEDYGNVVRNTPREVVVPTSHGDVVSAVRRARFLRRRLTPRGQGHAPRGQSQCCHCTVMDMSSMRAVLDIGESHITVQGGAMFRDIIDGLAEAGKTTPVQPDFQGLTIGGLMSAGGLGPAGFKQGMIVDAVLGFKIVDGNARTYYCTPDNENAELFRMVLGGMGQFGVVTEVTLRTVPRPKKARTYSIVQTPEQMKVNYAKSLEATTPAPFDELQTFMEPVERDSPESPLFFYPPLSGQWPNTSNGWLYKHDVTVLYNDESDAPNDQEVMSYFGDLAMPGAAWVAADQTYEEHLYRLEFPFSLLKASGQWYAPHVWLDIFIGNTVDEATAYVDNTLTGTDLADVAGGSVMMMYPFDFSRMATNSDALALPAGKGVAMGLLREASPPVTLSTCCPIMPMLVCTSGLRSPWLRPSVWTV
ncbi:MAG: hypothetical protein MHM6MM_000326 [Cercozoa sp. M6MM]